MTFDELMKNKGDYRFIKDALWAYGRLDISKKQFMSFLETFGQDMPNIFDKNYKTFNRMKELRHTLVRDHRQLEVMYITGGSGLGKTTAAKYIAEQLHYDYFVSGSGEDILDGYDKEECIILDDYRPNVMSFSELLKFLDNHTNSSVKSRYVNKDISNCKLIVITSIVEPDQLYRITSATDESSQSYQEPLEQLMRRLKHTVYTIILGVLWKKHNEEQEPFIMMDDIFKYFNIDLSKKDDTSLVDSLKTATKERVYHK